MDLGGVDGAGDHLEPATEVQLVVGQQFPKRAIDNVPESGQHRVGQGVCLVDVGEPAAGHIQNPTQPHRQSTPNQTPFQVAGRSRIGHDLREPKWHACNATRLSTRPRIRLPALQGAVAFPEKDCCTESHFDQRRDERAPFGDRVTGIDNFIPAGNVDPCRRRRPHAGLRVHFSAPDASAGPNPAARVFRSPRNRFRYLRAASSCWTPSRINPKPNSRA